MKKKHLFAILIIIKSAIVLSVFLYFFISGNHFSVNKKNKEKKSIKIEITEHISVYFTNPYSKFILENDLIDLLKKQSEEDYLDLCFYGLDKGEVIEAIENAIERGVHIRFIGNMDGADPVKFLKGYDYRGYYRIADALDKKFPVGGKKRINFPVDNGFDDFILINKKAIMHNKFALFADEHGNKYLFTGSTNVTNSCFERNNNNSLIMQDRGIFNTYRKYFENLLNKNHSLISSHEVHDVDGIKFEVFFTSDDALKPADYIVKQISGVKKSIYFMIFSFTNKKIYNAILKKSGQGIEVKGIFDESQLCHSAEELFMYSKVSYRIDGNDKIADNGVDGGKLHHKVMILDYDEEDPVVITGSFNWTDNANFKNDENLLMIHSRRMAEVFLEEFRSRWNEARIIDKPEMGDTVGYQDIIINEVMWMGSRLDGETELNDDEFIELKNNTDRKINLSGWRINGAGQNMLPLILKGGSINPNDYLIIRNNNNLTAFAPQCGIIKEKINISNNSLALELIDAGGSVIDCAGNGKSGMEFSGYNGKNGLKKSMARHKKPGNGRVRTNWFISNSQVNIKNQFDFLLYNCATPGTDNAAKNRKHKPLDIVISEICWAGTNHSSSDEWFEIFNNTENDINLAGFMVKGDLDIHLKGIIKKKSYYLLERTDESSVPGIKSDLIYTGSLGNKGGKIAIMYDNLKVDEVDMHPWARGSVNPKRTMERINYNKDGNSNNWKNGRSDIGGAKK